MTAALYNLWKKAIMDGSTNSNITGGTDATNGPYAALANISAGYTFSQTHQFFSSVGSTALPTGSYSDQNITSAVTSVSPTDGVFSGANVTYTAVSPPSAGASVGAIIIYRKNTGANTTWRLMSYYDTTGGGLPVTPNGGNITIQWNASGIFQLSDAGYKYEIARIGQIGPLPVYEYRYRCAESPVCRGFVAQEVEKVIPEAVRVFGGRKHVNYARAIEKCLQIH